MHLGFFYIKMAVFDMTESRYDRLARLIQELSDKQAAYNALGSSQAGWKLTQEIKDLRTAIAVETQYDQR